MNNATTEKEKKYKLLHKDPVTEEMIEINIRKDESIKLTKREIEGILFIEIPTSVDDMAQVSRLRDELVKVGLVKGNILLHPANIKFYTCRMDDDEEV